MMRRLCPLLLVAVQACPPVLAAEVPDDAVAVSVAREADHILLAAEFRVPVDVRTAWSVLTDFTHMPEFLPGLKESLVLAQNGQRLTVQQKGESTVGLFPMEYESLRAIELKPYQSIRSRTLKGSMGSVEGVTRLMPEGQGVTLVVYSAQVQPDSSLAALVPSRYLREELMTQFQAMRAEMLRRARLQLGKSVGGSAGG
ncbi:MAG: SRPBCC family protein [Thiobacillaceae bacterium]